MSKQIEEVMGLVVNATCAGIAYGEAESGAISSNCLAALHKAEAAVDAKLRELLPVWQPIESAPKDEAILVAGSKRMGVCVGRNDSRDGWETETTSEWVSIYKPTHWMPLPAPPRCEYCDGTGDVHTITGEWRGLCSCPAGKNPEPL